MAYEERLDLLGMLWYHECVSQKDAEDMLESCKDKCSFMIREYKGCLYLSASFDDMYNHLPVTRSRIELGYTLSGHHNLFKTLQDLVSHHQQYVIYTDNGEFTLQTACHKDYKALAMNFINDFRGDCLVRVKESSITIAKRNGAEIGTWLNKYIREFRLNDEKYQFSFKSGRRGPFGVAEYLFFLTNRVYYSLRETVNRIADGRSITGFDKISSANGIDEDYKPPVPSHGRKSSCQIQDEHRYDEPQAPLPFLNSLRQKRSSSSPNLSDNHPGRFTERTSSGSTKSNPLCGISRDHLPSTKVAENPVYQVPRPTPESIYDVPRSSNDPRNIYQVPRPAEGTYSVPRPTGRQEEDSSSVMSRTAARKIVITSHQVLIEHSYEDPDKV